ncbi:DUF4156 domain-containing protein [Bacteriovoracaceae bacterium]|nr:DUF4156 domain-containing protein [Bacteriovoracaceae bacterium]
MKTTISSLMLMFALLSLFGCAVSEKTLSSDGNKVKVLSMKEVEDCTVIDKVVGKNDLGSDELAQNHAKNLAADKDGNAVYFDDMVSNGKKIEAHATVYKCKN